MVDVTLLVYGEATGGLDGLAFDPFSFQQDDLTAPEVVVGGITMSMFS